MKRQRHASSRSDRCRRNPRKVSQRYGCTTCGASRRHSRCTSAAPASSAVAALSKADAPAPMTTTVLPRTRSKSNGCDEFTQRSAGKPASAGGIDQRPTPSWPVASTILRAWSVRRCPPDSTSAASRSLPATGAMRSSRVSLRTGTFVMRRTHSRYSAHRVFGSMSSASHAASPKRASYQARQVRLGMSRSGPV